MDSLNTREQLVRGLEERIRQLRADERLFQRAAGLRAQQGKDADAAAKLREAREREKARLVELANEKSTAMKATATAIAERMAQVLPHGRAEFRVDDEGGVFLGWEIPGHGVVPYSGLSGGQRVMFESALAYALTRPGTNPVIVIEGAEMGVEIGLLLDAVAKSNIGVQIVACTCHDLPTVPSGWMMTRIEPNGGAVHEL